MNCANSFKDTNPNLTHGNDGTTPILLFSPNLRNAYLSLFLTQPASLDARSAHLFYYLFLYVAATEMSHDKLNGHQMQELSN